MVDVKVRSKVPVSLRSKLLGSNTLGSGISINIVHLDTNKTEIFDIYSSYTALGAQYLGEDSFGNYRILFFEITQNEDFTLATATSLRIIDKKGNLIGIRELNKQVKSIPNQVKVFDGQVYFLNSQDDCVQILKLNDPETSTVGNYKSSLGIIIKPDISNIDNNIELLRNSSITRSEIMAIATSYHTSFSWTCTSANLAYLEYWEKPSYVSTAGTYTCMPYRWGGFDNQSGYNTKLTNGYRVGQTATTYLWNTGGLDCAGYVSRCWELDQHYYTGALGGISSEINFEDLQSGDALNSTDHVMLFDYYNSSNGTYILYECTTTSNYDRVSHTVRTAASIESTYTPIKYDYTTD